MTASPILPLLALVLGFALARANTCTVASVERLVVAGRLSASAHWPISA